MTAGKGIVHSEMPCGEGEGRGLQLWVNLPGKHKLCEPRYQELKAEEVPRVEKGGVKVAVIAGKAMGVESKIYTITPVHYLDFELKPGASYFQEVTPGWNIFVYILEGEGMFGPKESERGKTCTAHHTILFNQDGDGVRFQNTGKEVLRFVFIAGEPIGESVVQYGPFVMNTEEEIRQAMKDYGSCTNGFESAKGWQSENGKALIANIEGKN